MDFGYWMNRLQMIRRRALLRTRFKFYRERIRTLEAEVRILRADLDGARTMTVEEGLARMKELRELEPVPSEGE